MSLGYTVATLLALDDVLHLFQLQSVNIVDSTTQVTVDLEIQSSRRQIISLTEGYMDEVDGLNKLIKKSCLWCELLGQELDNDILALGRWMLAKTLLEEVSSATIRRENKTGNKWILKYLFRQITVRRVIDLGDLEEEYQKRLCALAMTQGYSIEEVIGKTIKVTTPTGFIRNTNGDYCDCAPYLKTKQKCLHMRLAESYLSNRKIYLDYEVATRVSAE